jgi:hypothetical protein
MLVADSSLCILDGAITCHQNGIHIQAYVKKLGHWPKGVPGDHINNHMKETPLGYCEMLVQQMDNNHFLVHCCRDADWVLKIISMYRMLDEIQDHPTVRLMAPKNPQIFGAIQPLQLRCHQ